MARRRGKGGRLGPAGGRVVLRCWGWMWFLVTPATVGANGSPAERKAELVVAPGDED